MGRHERVLIRILLLATSLLIIAGCSRSSVLELTIDQLDGTVLTVGDVTFLSATLRTRGDADTRVRWRSSDEAVVSVHPEFGVAFATGAGSATVSATSVGDPTVGDERSLTVVAPQGPSEVSVSIVQPLERLCLGERVTFTATVSGPDLESQDVTWSSNDHTVATIHPTTGELSGRGVGIALVTATSTADTRKRDTVELDVSGACFTSVLAGLRFSVGVRAGALVVWGADRTDVEVVEPAAGVVFVTAVALDDLVYVLDADGRVWEWNQLAREPPLLYTPGPITFVSIDAGVRHVVALDDLGRVWGWGANESGQLGPLASPTGSGPPIGVPMPEGVQAFTAVAAGGAHSVALDDLGRVWGWGSGSSGQLGNDSLTGLPSPTPATMPDGTSFVTVSAAGVNTFALDTLGRAWGWGDNTAGSVGDGTTIRRLVPSAVAMPDGAVFTDISSSSNGAAHAFAIDTLGRAWGWGLNSDGALGVGGDTGAFYTTPTPVAMPAGTALAEIAAGPFHTLALQSDGGSWAWGRNDSRQLGDGTLTRRLEPVPVRLQRITP